ncbi:MAG TPA: hypothetical protein DCL48_13940 [Alphaproteobacteria bacterium]|nr:hypothetical protein [Alphaproteobacteria bacterium]
MGYVSFYFAIGSDITAEAAAILLTFLFIVFNFLFLALGRYEHEDLGDKISYARKLLDPKLFTGVTISVIVLSVSVVAFYSHRYLKQFENNYVEDTTIATATKQAINHVFSVIQYAENSSNLQINYSKKAAYFSDEMKQPKNYSAYYARYRSYRVWSSGYKSANAKLSNMDTKFEDVFDKVVHCAFFESNADKYTSVEYINNICGRTR